MNWNLLFQKLHFWSFSGQRFQLTHLSKSPGATIKLSKTACTLETKLDVQPSSAGVGLKSWLRFNNAYKENNILNVIFYDIHICACLFPLTAVRAASLSSTAGETLGKTTSAKVRSNGCLGTKVFLNGGLIGPRIGRPPRIPPRTILFLFNLLIFTKSDEASTKRKNGYIFAIVLGECRVL